LRRFEFLLVGIFGIAPVSYALAEQIPRFSTDELDSIRAGRFWEKEVPLLDPALESAKSNPVEAISSLDRELKAQFIRLLVVAVPPRTALYPERFGDGRARPDANLNQFYETLRKRGVEVLDLQPLFLAHRSDPEGPSFLEEDFHWSPRGIELAAEQIATWIRTSGTCLASPRVEFKVERKQQAIQIPGSEASTQTSRQMLSVNLVRQIRNGKREAPRPDSASPVLIFGDCFAMYFSRLLEVSGLTGAGVSDHLSLRLGFPVDLLAIQNAQAGILVELRRQRERVAKKKCLVWVLSATAFPKPGAWPKVQVFPAKK
jgi:hypothetical protein